MQLGWIDFSKTERSKILTVLDLLSESGTLDELGIAAVRDGFSGYFFPGTSTIQTRAKYFLIVPYAFKQLEKSSETNPRVVLRMLDEIERKCGEIFLRKNRTESGLIGKNSLQNGTWVKRTPASIYWAGLRTYGIFKGGHLSLSQYVVLDCKRKSEKENLKKLGNRKDQAEEYECDDKTAGHFFSMQFWKMPLYTDGWLEQLQMKLSVAEAAFLKEQIMTSCKGTIMAYVLEHNITEFLDCTSFQDLAAIIDKFPEDIQEMYWLASAFSDFMYAIRVVYNMVVSDGKNEEANSEWERLFPMLSELAAVDIDYIFEKLHIFHKAPLRVFLKQCRQYMLDREIEALKKRMTEWEVQLKGTGRAKTVHAGEFNPQEWFGGKFMDYRLGNARIIIRDIMESEDENHAES